MVRANDVAPVPSKLFDVSFRGICVYVTSQEWRMVMVVLERSGIRR